MNIYPQPIGASIDEIFTFLDFYKIQNEFVTRKVYFGNNEATIACTDSVFDPRVQWCAPKAQIWEELPFKPDPYYNVVVVVPPLNPPHPPPMTVTPEPVMIWLMLGLIFALLLAKRNW